MNLRGNIDTLTLLNICRKIKNENKDKKVQNKEITKAMWTTSTWQWIGKWETWDTETWQLGELGTGRIGHWKTWSTGADLLPKATFSNLFLCTAVKCNWSFVRQWDGGQTKTESVTKTDWDGDGVWDGDWNGDPANQSTDRRTVGSWCDCNCSSYKWEEVDEWGK